MGFTRNVIVFLLILCIGHSTLAQSSSGIVDLRTQWLVTNGAGFELFDDQNTASVYFWISANTHKGGRLTIAGRHLFSVWINSKLVWSGTGTAHFSVDSLARMHSAKLFVGIHSRAGFSNISTVIEQRANIDDQSAMAPRPGNYFLDFALIASLLLLVSFTLFWRTNPVLTRDYFNLAKLITSLDRTESGFGLRIASSVNILYYVFGSCFLALILLVAFHLMGPVTLLSKMFQVQSTAQGFLQWFFLSLGVASLLFVKLLWIVIFASLFRFKDTVRFQFFNFVRVIFISVAILVIIGFVFVLFNVRSDLFYYYQLYLLVALFVVGAIVVYIKLMARLPYHFFHLFSYLCASEIIPLLILTKLMLY